MNNKYEETANMNISKLCESMRMKPRDVHPKQIDIFRFETLITIKFVC